MNWLKQILCELRDLGTLTLLVLAVWNAVFITARFMFHRQKGGG